MSWVYIALSAAALAGIINVVEKTVLYRYIKSPLTLPFLVSLSLGGVGTILLLTASWSEETTFRSIVWGIVSGVFWGMSSLIFLRVLFSQEVSRSIPVFHTNPIFAALLAVIFLDEELSAFSWVAIVATVFGAILLFLRRDQEYHRIFLHPSFYALVVSSILIACAQVTGKNALEDLSVLNTHGLRSVSGAGVFLIGSLRRATILEVRDLLRRRSPGLAIIGLNNFIFIHIPMLLLLWALSLGPVSLVTTLVVTHAFFVLLFGTAVTLRFGDLLGEHISTVTTTVKAVSTALIVGGVVTIILQ